jgi:hypothetical protein
MAPVAHQLYFGHHAFLAREPGLRNGGQHCDDIADFHVDVAHSSWAGIFVFYLRLTVTSSGAAHNIHHARWRSKRERRSRLKARPPARHQGAPQRQEGPSQHIKHSRATS